jgi:drug/metabolite transporter (DMT)-like permease
MPSRILGIIAALIGAMFFLGNLVGVGESSPEDHDPYNPVRLAVIIGGALLLALGIILMIRGSKSRTTSRFK